MGQQFRMEPDGSSDILAHRASASPAGQPTSQAPKLPSDESPNRTAQQAQRSPEREYWQPPSERIDSSPPMDDEVPADEATISTWLTRPMVVMSRSRLAAKSVVSATPAEPHIPREWPKVTVWQAVKWPLRKLLLGVYMAAETIRAQPRKALAITAIILAVLVVGGIASQTQRLTTHTTAPLVAVQQPGLPALPNSVQRYLQGQQRFNAAEMWATYTPATRASTTATEAQLSATLAQQKADGLRITRFVYSGGYRAPDGTAHYTIEVYANEKGKIHTYTWFFAVGADGLITQRVDLTPPQ